MTYCNDDNLKNLKRAYSKKKLFSKKLEKETFLLIIEILLNISSKDGELRKCLSSKVLKKLKRNKETIRYLVDGENEVEKRRKKFRKLSSSKKKIVRLALKEFLMKCIENCD